MSSATILILIAQKGAPKHFPAQVMLSQQPGRSGFGSKLPWRAAWERSRGDDAELRGLEFLEASGYKG